MIDNIENPHIITRIHWLSASEGGRRSGPPTAPVYAATCMFDAPPDDSRSEPDCDKFSILLQKQSGPGEDGVYKALFLSLDLTWPLLKTDGHIRITEGPKIVATGVILQICST